MLLTEAERLVVFEAYEAAARGGKDASDCYLAASAVLRALRSELDAGGAVREVVRIITDHPRFAERAGAARTYTQARA